MRAQIKSNAQTSTEQIVEDLVSRGLQSPWGIAVDTQGGKMYWTDAGTNKNPNAQNLDGTGAEIIISNLANPDGIALDVQAPKDVLDRLWHG